MSVKNATMHEKRTARLHSTLQNLVKIPNACRGSFLQNSRFLKWYYEENHIFPIEAISKHKQVLCMRRKMLFTGLSTGFEVAGNNLKVAGE